MPVLEFGPDTNGWLTIQDDNNNPLGFLVWVGDSTLPGYETYQDGMVYWKWDATPFPPQSFTMTTPPGTPPGHSQAMMAFPNESFSSKEQLEEPDTVTVTPPQTAYRVTPTPNSSPPSEFGLIATPSHDGFLLHWSASGDKPPEQSYFWPISSPTATLAFHYLAQNTITFPAMTTFFPVSEAQLP